MKQRATIDSRVRTGPASAVECESPPKKLGRTEMNRFCAVFGAMFLILGGLVVARHSFAEQVPGSRATNDDDLCKACELRTEG